MSSTQAEKEGARDWLLTREGWEHKGGGLYAGNCIYCYEENKEPGKGYYKDSTGYYNCHRGQCTPGGKEASELRREFNFSGKGTGKANGKENAAGTKGAGGAKRDQRGTAAQRYSGMR